MRSWPKRLLILLILLTAVLLLAMPGALADWGKQMSDFDSSDWEDYYMGDLFHCEECDGYALYEDCCPECYVCYGCLMDSTDHCPMCACHDQPEDTWCESCGCAPCCWPFEIAIEKGWGEGSICDYCLENGDADFDHCMLCYNKFDDLPGYGYCVECFMCFECWDVSEHCSCCGGEGEICPECDPNLCYDCHEEFGGFCPVCGETCISGLNTNGAMVCGGGEHCVENCCNWEWLCESCSACFFEEQESYCEVCNHCDACALAEGNHCEACYQCLEGEVEPCGDGTFCEGCCPDETMEHCYKCDLHVDYTTDSWCLEGGEGSHCETCMEDYCEECMICFECETAIPCSDCMLCIDCCLDISEAAGCVCGMCVEDGDFDEHLSCPECDFNLCEAGEELCELCQRCSECCQISSEDAGCACGMCVEDSGFEEHLSCPDCDYNLCETGDELCDTCELCPDCCAANSESEGCICGMCVENFDFDSHVYCPDCGGNVCESGDLLCDQCLLCPECCLIKSEDGGCICGMCVEEYGFAAHVRCKGCDDGLCASGYPPCDYCGMCVNCCEERKCIHGVCYADRYQMRMHTCALCGDCFDANELCVTCGENQEVICLTCCEGESLVMGCSHGICLNDAEAWIAHWCYDCGKCVVDCPHDTPQGEHPITPSLSYMCDKELHWRPCRYCDNPEHYSEKAAHLFVRGECRYCSISENAGMAPYIIRQPRSATVIPPNPGEPSVNTVMSAKVGSLAKYLNYCWEIEKESTEMVNGEPVTTYTWVQDYHVELDWYYDEDGSRIMTGTRAIGPEACLSLDDKGNFGKYRLRVWNEYGEAYSEPVSIRVMHNKQAYTYLKEGDVGYASKVLRYTGVHWPCCSICGEGEVPGEAEVHVGEWVKIPETSNTYCRTCEICGAYEKWYGDDLVIMGHPKNTSVTLEHEPGVVKTVTMSIPESTVTAAGKVADDYNWQFSKDGVTWYTASNRAAEELETGLEFGPNFYNELEIYTTSETPCNGTKYHFRCVVGALPTNEATLRIKCNDMGHDFYTQKQNNAINSRERAGVMDKHWSVCSGCGRWPDYENAEYHTFGGTLHDDATDLDYKVCTVCGYEEWEYADDVFHFEVNPVSMRIENAKAGDQVTLTAKAAGTDQDIYYMWHACVPTRVSDNPNGWVVQSWDPVAEGFGCDTFTYTVKEGDCKYSETSKYHRAFICFAKAGGEIDPYESNWAEGVIASNYVKLDFGHNQDGFNYDDLYHWPCCDQCYEQDNYELPEAHDMGQWHALSSNADGSVIFERSCFCGYTETTTATRTVSWAYADNIMRPAPGMIPDMTGLMDSYYTRSHEIKWFRLDENGEKIFPAMSGQDVFEEDTVYRVEVTMHAEPGVGYALSDAMINNEPAEYYFPAGGVGVVTMYKDYDTANCITAVEIYDILQPMVGNAIDREAKLGYEGYDYLYVSGEKMFTWYYRTEESGEEYPVPDAISNYSDYFYRLETVLQADEGKWFAVDELGTSMVRSWVNRSRASSKTYDSLTYGTCQQLRVSFEFGKPNAASGVLVTGHNLNANQTLKNGRVVNGTLSGSGWAHCSGSKLTLNNFSGSVSGGFAGIDSSKPLTIELIGENSITVSDNHAGINVAGNLIIEGSGSLVITSSGDGIDINEGNFVVNNGTVIVNAAKDALYLGNYWNDTKTLTLGGGYLKLASSGGYGMWMNAVPTGATTPLYINGGTLVMQGADGATNVDYIDGLATVMVGSSNVDAAELQDGEWMSSYAYVKIVHSKDGTVYYVEEQPVDTGIVCGPDTQTTVNFRLNKGGAAYTWYLDLGDGFVPAEELAMSGVISAAGWDSQELLVQSGIITAQAYCEAVTDLETFTSNTVTLTMEHNFTGYNNIGDGSYHTVNCDRCLETYQQAHTQIYRITQDATTTTAGSFRFDCAECGYASTSYGFTYAQVKRYGTSLVLDWNDGLGTQTKKTITRYANYSVSLVPEREGHRFLGWAMLPDATEPDYTDTISAVKSVVKVYAVWEEYDYSIGGWVTSNGTAENPVTVTIDLYKLGTDETTGEETETLVQTVEAINNDANMAASYEFGQLWPGSYRLKASADGYEDTAADVTVTDSSVTQDVRMTRPTIAKMDFTVQNLAAGNYCAGITVKSGTAGVLVNDEYGAGGYQLYADSDGSIGDALTSGQIRGGSFYWVRVAYTVDGEYPFDWNSYSHVMNGCVASPYGSYSAGEYACFRMYVPANGAQASGCINVESCSEPEAYGYAQAYVSLTGNMNCTVVDQMWQKNAEAFTGMFEPGETYTLYVTVAMSDGSAFPADAYVTFNGKAIENAAVENGLLVIRRDYEANDLMTFKLPAALTKIEAEAFEGSTAEAFEIPAGCTSIGSRAFADSPNLTCLIIRSSTIAMADDMLDGNFEATGACRVTILCPSDSDAVSWAKMHGVNCRTLD